MIKTTFISKFFGTLSLLIVLIFIQTQNCLKRITNNYHISYFYRNKFFEIKTDKIIMFELIINWIVNISG